jgi:RNA polymerase subunit RPABC4/transcription elongation factor Spt4
MGPGIAFLMIAFATLVFGLWVMAVGYVNREARRRGMRHVMWTLLVIFIPNAIGFILYFILRNPLMKECPQCRKAISGEFAYCPECGQSVAPSCPSCRRAVEPGWSHCPSCGKGLKAA